MNTAALRTIAVIDIGKTNAKLALVDLETRAELSALRTPNRPLDDGPYPHHDVEGIWSFILDALTTIGQVHSIDAISVATHGATAALLDAQGELVLPVLDYEFIGPDTVRDAYEAVRPPFSQTGSPKLPAGLNLGAQIFWLAKTFPDDFARVHAIVPYPQYWAGRLSGVFASEVTSLGCHTDLWNPHANDFSALVDSMGWRDLFPPLRRAASMLGPILPDIAGQTGLDTQTPVVCGIHDSNASLLPHLLSRQEPFAVVSTGTWVVAMAVGGRPVSLDAARDVLINVNAHGDAVPSARFMGGREFEMLTAGHERGWNEGDFDAVLASKIMLLPSIQPGSGPYPNRKGGWIRGEPDGGKRFVAISFYLAMMTATCLDLVGAQGEIVVEGPFADNRPYVAMLAAAAGRPVVPANGLGTGTSIGAALLARDDQGFVHGANTPMPDIAALLPYAASWRLRVDPETT